MRGLYRKDDRRLFLQVFLLSKMKKNKTNYNKYFARYVIIRLKFMYCFL
jgi:hypothetical protein